MLIIASCSGRHFREMTDLVTMINDIVTPIWGKSVAFNKLAHVWEWKTGERLELNYYINEKSFDLYQGKSFAVIAWEELSLQENLTGFFKMYSSLRSALPEDVMPRQVLFTANPGGASHNAIAHHFQLTGIPPAVGPCIVDVNGEKRRCFNIGFQDDALLRRTTPNYMNDIEIACLGDEPRLQSWKYGNWSIVAGGALDDIFFKHGKNIFVEPFEIPAEGRLFASYDHGSTHPYAYLIWWVSNGCTIRLKSGRMMPTKVGTSSWWVKCTVGTARRTRARMKASPTSPPKSGATRSSAVFVIASRLPANGLACSSATSPTIRSVRT